MYTNFENPDEREPQIPNSNLKSQATLAKSWQTESNKGKWQKFTTFNSGPKTLTPYYVIPSPGTTQFFATTTTQPLRFRPSWKVLLRAIRYRACKPVLLRAIRYRGLCTECQCNVLLRASQLQGTQFGSYWEPSATGDQTRPWVSLRAWSHSHNANFRRRNHATSPISNEALK